MVQILQKEAPVLRTKAEPVNLKDFDSPRLKKILHDMQIALEKEHDGVAIAAPQIGVPLRIFIVSHRAFEINSDAPKTPHTGSAMPIAKDVIFINPVITKLSRKKRWLSEGCLSVRWLYGEVSRSDKATVEAYDEHGKKFSRGGSGLMAQIFQHETDHLNGVLFIDEARNVEVITQEDQERMRLEHEATGNF